MECSNQIQCRENINWHFWKTSWFASIQKQFWIVKISRFFFSNNE